MIKQQRGVVPERSIVHLSVAHAERSKALGPLSLTRQSQRMLIQKYSSALIEPAVTLLTDAFVTNPLHTSCFGPAALEQNRLFFRIGLRHMFTGNALVAVVDGQIRGYIHFKPFPQCLPPPEEIPLAVASLFTSLGESIPKIVQWFSRWCHLDPGRPHIHLGPLGVSPCSQGSGIGTALMNRYIDHLIKENTAGYLETDRAENVAFYEKFGFVVKGEDYVIGVPVWYMWRDQES